MSERNEKCVAIITLTQTGQNYGNRLQNYALQELLSNIGVRAETIWHSSNPIHFSYWRIKKNLKQTVKAVLRKSPHRNLRYRRFDIFNKKYIRYSRTGFDGNRLIGKAPDGYDCFIVGSDQVWNTNFGSFKNSPDIYLASFAPPSKRIAYAASFGVNEIDGKYLPKFRAELSEFKAVSVREREGVRICEELGVHAETVLDPTMMLTAQEWDGIARKPDFVYDEPFIATYFLGGRSEQINRYIESLAGDRRVINLEHEQVRPETKEEIAVCTAAPDEFVWLISHADCVLTDSFHASVFSILYHKPFFVYERLVNEKSGGMESRLDTLLGTFGLEMCRGDIKHPEGIPPVGNWDTAEKILEEERNKSLAFLKQALETE